MSNIISTYFYHDVEEKGATYGNIFLDLEKRNFVYWQTVYTLFFTSIVHNKYNNEIKYVLFTNIPNFPLREDIESLGVVVFDDVILTKRNKSKWATVNFFFDVIYYINENKYFKEDDNILMLDTDCIAINSSDRLFSEIIKNKFTYVHKISKINSYNDFFHGLKVIELIKIYKKIFKEEVHLSENIGGELFLFNKKYIFDFINKYDIFINSQYSKIITTEEQVLTLFSNNLNFKTNKYNIYRIWLTYKHIDIPKNYRNYTFLHFPSEKLYGLDRLYNKLNNLDHRNITPITLNEIIFNVIPLNNLFILYLNRILVSLRNKIFSDK